MTKEKIARKCEIENCEKPYAAHGFCQNHLRSWKLYGDPHIKKNSSEKGCLVLNCLGSHYGHGLCIKHYARWKNHGDPYKNADCMGQGDTPEERFWSRIDKTPGLGRDGDCWEWTGKATVGSGKCKYGAVVINRKKWITHRYAYFLDTGKMPTLDVLHSCDNPLCCNPKHLREGTSLENSRDMVERDRQLRGERNNKAKLTEVDIRQIRLLRKAGYSNKEISTQYSVTSTAIWNITTSRTWKYLQ